MREVMIQYSMTIKRRQQEKVIQDSDHKKHTSSVETGDDDRRAQIMQ